MDTEQPSTPDTAPRAADARVADGDAAADADAPGEESASAGGSGDAATAGSGDAAGWRWDRGVFGVALVIALLQLAMLASPMLRHGAMYAEHDLREQALPWRVFEAVALRQGELGVWNPFLARGYDHLGEGQAGVLHPVHVLGYRLLPLEWMVGLELIGAWPLAWLGMWLWLWRGLKLARGAAALGATTTGFSVFMYAHLTHMNMLWVFAHLPWLLWAVDTCVTRPAQRWRAAAWTGVIVASMHLLGHPQTTWFGALGVGVLLLWRGVGRWRDRDWRHGMALACVGAVGGCLIGMLQLLPTAALASRSPRTEHALTAEDRVNFSLHPVNLLLQAAPAFLEARIAPTPITDPAKPNGYTLVHSFQEFPAYFGLGLLALIWSGAVLFGARLWRERRAATLLLGGATLLVILLAAGRYGFGLIQIQRWVPLVNGFRVPSRHIALLLIVAGAAAAWTLHRLARERPRPSRAQWLLLTLPPVLGLAALAANRVIAAGAGHITIAGNALAVTRDLGPVLVAPVLALVGYVALAIYLRHGHGWCLVLLAAAVLLDLGASNRELLAGVTRPTPLRPLSDLHAMAADLATADPNVRSLGGLNDPFWQGVYLANGYIGLPPREPLSLDATASVAPRALLAGVQLAAVNRILTSDSDDILVPRALPRARLVPVLRHSATPLADAELGHVDLSSVALCLPDAAAPLDGPPLAPGEGARIETGTRFDTLHIRVRADQERLLVLADRVYPGWTASLHPAPASSSSPAPSPSVSASTAAGTPIPLPLIPLFNDANVGLRIPAGEHLVILQYRNPALLLALWLAIPGCLLLLALRIQHHRMRPPPCPLTSPS